MRVEFNQGVPSGCIKWLWDNVGPGNIEPRGNQFSPCWGDAWKFERVEVEIPSNDPAQDSNIKYVPTITVKDPKMAVLFALRWS